MVKIRIKTKKIRKIRTAGNAAQRRTVDVELEKCNFKKAGEVLAEV